MPRRATKCRLVAKPVESRAAAIRVGSNVDPEAVEIVHGQIEIATNVVPVCSFAAAASNASLIWSRV